MRGHPHKKQHRVVCGDTLSHIALRYYHNANLWPAIWEANARQIHKERHRRDGAGIVLGGPDWDWIFPGQVLCIPPMTVNTGE